MSAPVCQHCGEWHVTPVMVPAPVLAQPFAQYALVA